MSSSSGTGVPAATSVVVHPLVLLSVTDHYARVAKDTKKRVVGVLLGGTSNGVVDVTNSFAVPFEEDLADPSIFFLDHGYLETMYAMHRKISIKEKIVGFYSTGPKIRPADIEIDRLFRKYHPSPVFVIVDVRPDVEGLPITTYQSVEEVVEGKTPTRAFAHVPSEVGASEPEEVGVEHLLRGINDPTASTLAGDLRAKLAGLAGLSARLKDVSAYLTAVASGALPPNNEILFNVQAVLNSLPNTSTVELGTALQEVVNDHYLALYTGSTSRSVLGLHDLLVNRSKYSDVEEGSGGNGGAAAAPAAGGEAKAEAKPEAKK